MKILTILYSLNGNTRWIGGKLAEAVGAEIEVLETKTPMPAAGFRKFILGGLQVLRKTTPELLPLQAELRDYDMLFIGTPVWAGAYAPALRTFFAEHRLSNRRIALFCCHAGGPGGTLRKMQQALESNRILGAIDFREPLRSDPGVQAQRAAAWAQDMTSLACDRRQSVTP